MPRWFISTRTHSVGGPVGTVKILDADRPGHVGDLEHELLDGIGGREVLFGVHGFNVNQSDGIAHMTFWFNNMQIGNAVPIGILWPGDCIIPIFVDYVVEGHEAIRSGELLADFFNAKFTAVASLSFASHSLGARVVLETIAGLSSNLRVRRVVLMAGAIDDNCLTAEYSRAAKKVEEISILASRRDDVLALAYPLANPLQGIIDQGHPYYHAALGREGPDHPSLLGPTLTPKWEIPNELDYGHLDYLPGKPITAAFPLPIDIPPENGPVPPTGTPPDLSQPKQWKPAWSAAFVSSRYK